VRNLSKGEVLATCATVADTSKARRTGLLGRDSLAPGEGLWIVPCEAVHCFGMKFSIDVLFLSRNKTIRKICHEMKPWRMSFCLPAHSVVELPAGTAARTGTERGDRLAFERVDN
jgi:uncharacterized membrane protein (UPF0127 family)